MENNNLFMHRLIKFTTNKIFAFSGIILVGLIIRMYYFPYDIPLTLDGLFYFKYAIDTSILGHLPEYHLTNNGWPVFLSVFFSGTNSENFLDYMTIQRLVSIIVSLLTAIPVYFLCKKFFEHKFAVVGSVLFIFEPRIIQNSISGATEPLFILLTASSLALFLTNSKKMIYLSFVVSALATIVRWEGITLFLAISILYLIKYRKNHKKILEYGILVGIYILVLTPMALPRMEVSGNETITTSIMSGSSAFSDELQGVDNNFSSPIVYLSNGFVQLGKNLGWLMIPSFILFAPIGLFLMFRNKFSEKISIILPIVILGIVGFYAYSRGIEELRYLFVLLPLLSVISLFTINRFLYKRKKQNSLLIILIISLIILSLGFLEWKKSDNMHEYEAYEISKKVVESATKINVYYPESKYVRVGEMHSQTLSEISKSDIYWLEVASARDYNTLTDFIIESKVSHLVVDGGKNRAQFLNDIFYNERDYPFLIKEYDSLHDDYKYHVKIFRIDYEKFNLENESVIVP